MKKCTTKSLAMFLGVILLSANGLAAAGSKLNDIRAGRNKGYTRLVLDAEGSRPLIIGPATAEDVTIVYEQLELTRESSVLFRNMIGAAANVSHHRQAGRSVITITFKNPNTTVRSFYMGGKSAEKGTYRLIMDLYPPGSAAAGPGALVPAASAKAAIATPTHAPAPAAPSPQVAAGANETLLPAAKSSQQFEEILPKTIETGSASQTARIEIASGGKKQGLHLAESLPKARAEGKKVSLLNASPPEKSLRASVAEQPSIRNEFRGGKDKSITVSKGAVPMVGKPAHILTIQPPQSDIKSDASGAIEKAFSEIPIQGDIFPHFKNLPGKKKEAGTDVQRKPPGIKEKTVSISPVVEKNVIQRQAVSYEKKGPIYKQESKGLVERALKLLSITLSCLVILVLHRANKIATNR